MKPSLILIGVTLTFLIAGAADVDAQASDAQKIKCGTRIWMLGEAGADRPCTILARTDDSLTIRTEAGDTLILDSSQVGGFYLSEIKSTKQGLKIAGIGAAIGLVAGVVTSMTDDKKGLGESAAGGIFLGGLGGFMLFTMGDQFPHRFEEIAECDSRPAASRPTLGVQFAMGF